MSEVTEEKKELALVTLPVEKQSLEVALLNDQFIDELLDKVRQTAGSVVGDLNTAKGRGVYITMADKVRKAKTAFEVRAKDLVAELKARPALIDASRKRFRDEMDKIAVEIRKPVTEWEAEQDRIAADKAAEEERLRIEAEAKKAAEELAKEIEMTHREALIDNYEFDRALEVAKAEAERQRIAHEEELKRQAEEQVKRELEEKIRLEREASERRERELKEAKEKAEHDAKEAQERAERDRIAAEQKVIADKKSAEEKAEREKQEAIKAEQLKAQQAADKIKRDTETKEAARLAEVKRVADEKAKREADETHRKVIGTAIVNALLANANIDRVQAIQILTALKDGLIPHTTINY